MRYHFTIHEKGGKVYARKCYSEASGIFVEITAAISDGRAVITHRRNSYGSWQDQHRVEDHSTAECPRWVKRAVREWAAS